ncbi:hypothetical protein bcgnr5371_07500 [Bacillus cereus]
MYKIGEVAELTGMGIHTLRYYEKLGLLPTPTRNSGMAFWDCCICDVMSVKNTKRF